MSADEFGRKGGSLDSVTGLAMAVIFPGLALGTTLVQQESPTAVMLGQCLNWTTMMGAAMVVLIVLRVERTVFLLVGLILLTRFGRIFVGDAPEFTLLYTVASGLLYALAGAAILWQHPAFLHRQLRLFLLISVPFMFAQLAGGPDWLYALRTDAHDPIYGRTMVQMLFVEEAVTFPTIQVRPAGILYANNFLAVIVAFVTAIHLGMVRDRHLTLTDAGLAAVIVLAMSKMVFAVYLIALVFYLAVGPSPMRRHMLKLTGLIGVFLLGYYFLFPATFLYNASPTNALVNVTIRWADFGAAMAGQLTSEVVISGFDGRVTARTFIVGTHSSYSQFARYLPYAAGAGLLVAPIFLILLRRLAAARPEIAAVARNTAVVLLLAPAIVSFIGNPIFWFLSGSALIPFGRGVFPFDDARFRDRVRLNDPIPRPRND